jgi:membrane fusion protein (multidrug efflux system)
VTLRTVFPNPDLDLLPGMYVRAGIEEGVMEQAILVPQRGVSHDPRGNATALVVNQDDKVEMRFLKVDRSFGDCWLVREGLAAGDRVILEGLQKVKPGIPVQTVPFEKKPGAATPAATVPAINKP